MSLSGIANELLNPAIGDHSTNSEGWQQWKQRDEQVNEIKPAHVTTDVSLGQRSRTEEWLQLYLMQDMDNVFTRNK